MIAIVRAPLLLVLAACWSSSSSAPPPTPPPLRPDPDPVTPGDAVESAPIATAPAPLPFVSACVSPNDPAIADVQRKAADATKQAFERELARQKLNALALRVDHHELARGLNYNAGGARAGTVVDKPGGKFIAAETAWSGNPGAPARWEFVQNHRGEVFRVVRQPAVATTKVMLCACRPQQCGPYGSPCPACGSTSQTMYGPLPAGATYKGELVIAYPANMVVIDYDPKQACPAPKACPPPPP